MIRPYVKLPKFTTVSLSVALIVVSANLDTSIWDPFDIYVLFPACNVRLLRLDDMNETFTPSFILNPSKLNQEL